MMTKLSGFHVLTSYLALLLFVLQTTSTMVEKLAKSREKRSKGVAPKVVAKTNADTSPPSPGA